MKSEELQEIIEQHPDPDKLRELLNMVAIANFHKGQSTGYRAAVTCQQVVPVGGNNGGNAA